jgi:hypothetical protein
MKGFVYSFTLAAGVLLLMQIPLFKYGVGFFAAIPLSVLAIPLRSLPHVVGYAILIFGAPSIAIIAHLATLRGQNLIKDSRFTLFAAAWIPFVTTVIHFLCEMSTGGSPAACRGFVPNF